MNRKIFKTFTALLLCFLLPFSAISYTTVDTTEVLTSISNDDFSSILNSTWTLKSGSNGEVAIADFPSSVNKSLKFSKISTNSGDTSYKKVVASTATKVIVEARIYPAVKGSDSYRVYNLMLTGSSSKIIAKIAFNGDFIKYTPTASSPETKENICPYTLGQWYDIKVEIDFNLKTYDVYVNNTKYLVDKNFIDNSATSLATIQGRIFGVETGEVYIDDLKVSQVTSINTYDDKVYEDLMAKWRLLLLTSNPSIGPYEITPYVDSDATALTNVEPQFPAPDGNPTGGIDPYIYAKIKRISDLAQSYWSSMNKTTERKSLWSDLTFTSKSAPVYLSYSRLYTMVFAYSKENSPLYGNGALLADIIGGLDWMYVNRYNESSVIYDNWWHWQIAIPYCLNNSIVLLYNKLTPIQINNYSKGIKAFIPTVSGSSTNEVWISLGVMLCGIINKDSVKIDEAISGFIDTMPYVTSTNGFYTDGSYIQHNHNPYINGYGVWMLRELSNVIYLLKGSPWEITDPSVQNVYKWVSDSYQPFIYNGESMNMVRGRFTYLAWTRAYSTIRGILMLAETASEQDATKYRKMVKEWVLKDTYHDYRECYLDIFSYTKIKEIMEDDSITPRGEDIAFKQFPIMDRAVFTRPGFAFGLSMHSSRVYNFEASGSLPTSTNGSAWHTSDGMTYLYNADSGQYNASYLGNVNWYRLPGTTVNKDTNIAYGNYSTKSWVGSADMLGLYGVTGMELNPYGMTLNAKKSWFMFDDEIVALGTGINAQDNTIIETIIDNRKLKSDNSNVLKINGLNKTMTSGVEETINDLNHIYLQGNVQGSDIGYYFPQPTQIKVLKEARGGTNFATMWFDHGTNPTNGVYSYVLLPNKTSDQVDAYSLNPDVSVIENSNDAQAVKEKNLNITGINFWNDAYKTVDIVTCNKKAAVMVKESDSDIELSVSDPTQLNTGTIDLELDVNANSVISADKGVTVTQLSPTIKLSINVNNAKGKTFKTKISLVPPAFQIEYYKDSVSQENKLSSLQTGKIIGIITVPALGVSWSDMMVAILYKSGVLNQIKLIPSEQIRTANGLGTFEFQIPGSENINIYKIKLLDLSDIVELKPKSLPVIFD